MTTDAQREAVYAIMCNTVEVSMFETDADWQDRVNAVTDEIIAAYEAAAWVKAEDVPDGWRGRLGLVWYPGRLGAERTVITVDHSREPRHCGGAMFRLWPAPPKEPADD